LLFSFKLVLFSSNFFDLDAYLFSNRSLLIFGERFLALWEFSSWKSALSASWQESFLSSDLAFREFHLYLQKMLITATTAVTLPVFAVSIAISSALAISLGAVAATLIGWGSVDKLSVPTGLSILRHLSTLTLVLLYPVFYSLSKLSLEKVSSGRVVR
jgi:hypothetical protein